MKKIFVNLVLVLSPFAMGLYAQCDSAIEIKVYFDLKSQYLNPHAYDVVAEGWEPPIDSSIRRIYFVHGLGGNGAAWEKAAQACQYKYLNIPGFSARKCETTLPNYSDHTANLLGASKAIREGAGNTIAAQAKDDRIGGIIEPSRSIIIAHSQGGIVARNLMHLDMVADTNNSSMYYNGQYAGMNYGGVVTIASPLQGAMILNNRPRILELANDGCKKLTAATIKGELPSLILPFFEGKLNALMEGACNVVANTALPMLFNSYYDSITASYTVGANMINTLNSDTLNQKYRNFPKMAFYAIEPQENIFWRTANWMTNNPNNADYFQANDDWKLLDSTVQSIINKFQAKKESHYAQGLEYSNISNAAVWLPLVTGFFITGIVASNVYGQKANGEYAKYWAYNDGLEWFNNINASWQIIIGVMEIHWKGFVPSITYKPENDGVVLAESAMDLPGATHSPVEIYPNKNSTVDIEKGSSHMQVRNDAGLKKALNDLFNGEHNKWFRTVEQK